MAEKKLKISLEQIENIKESSKNNTNVNLYVINGNI